MSAVATMSAATGGEMMGTPNTSGTSQEGGGAAPSSSLPSTPHSGHHHSPFTGGPETLPSLRGFSNAANHPSGLGGIENVDSIILIYDLDRDETFFRLENHWLPLIERCYNGNVSVNPVDEMSTGWKL